MLLLNMLLNGKNVLKRHTIEINKPFSVICKCRDWGAMQGFNYRDSLYHYTHLPRHLRCGHYTDYI